MNTSDTLYKTVDEFMKSVRKMPIATLEGEGVFIIQEKEWNAVRDAMFAYHTERQHELIANGTWQRVQQEKKR
jgi:hypothetical protein